MRRPRRRVWGRKPRLFPEVAPGGSLDSPRGQGGCGGTVTFIPLNVTKGTERHSETLPSDHTPLLALVQLPERSTAPCVCGSRLPGRLGEAGVAGAASSGLGEAAAGGVDGVCLSGLADSRSPSTGLSQPPHGRVPAPHKSAGVHPLSPWTPSRDSPTGLPTAEGGRGSAEQPPAWA